MKIAIGYHIQDGPWGGGNQFARYLAEALEERGDVVRYDLADADIDIIVLTDPRARSPSVSFGAGAILRYLLLRNSRALVVHRINECDERKGTRHMNSLLRRANYAADHTIFIGTWLKSLSVWRHEKPYSIILNGGDKQIFNAKTYIPWDGVQPLRLVTHHWGGNRMKGFDVYEALDNMLGEHEWKDRIKFTYIGNLPKDFTFRNARYLPPMQGEVLARELSAHHVYISASVNEPAGMHHIEGALCGLPLLFRRSGALPEYCQGYGVEFDGPSDFPAMIQKMMAEYAQFHQVMPRYPHTSARMCQIYLSHFDSLLAQRATILAGRKFWRSPWLVLRNQFPF